MAFVADGPWGLFVGEASLVGHSESLFTCLVYGTTLGLSKSAHTITRIIIEMLNFG